ncbi:MAG: efflux RND transporter periplasmic adaptor subunit [Gammaproteobacteria bacterium]|nr:MAG: efflux RND transporter periplasmic adaptor subunit [Gammaproteobacteria bacterium]
MPSHRIREALLAVAIVAAALVIMSLMIWLRPAPEIAEPIRKPLQVEAMVVAQKTLPIILFTQGTVQPRVRTELISEVRGQVVEVTPAFQAGSFFRAGDVLLRIDDRQYVAEVKRAEANVAKAVSDLAMEKGRAEVAYQDWVKAGKPKYRSEEAKELALRKPQVAGAQANLDFASAELERARGDLEHTVIRAPYDGLVQAKHVDVGQYVSVGTPLGQSFAVDAVDIRLPLPENRLDYLTLPENYDEASNTPLPVTLSLTINGNTEQWQGDIIRTEGVLDEQTRVLNLIARVVDPYGLNPDTPAERPKLRIGSFVEARIEGRPIDKLVQLPRHVLRAGNRVWVIDEDHRLRDRKVQVLVSEGDVVYIQSGLEDGERVCLTPVGNVLPGTQVADAAAGNNDTPVTGTTDGNAP